ncbi:MAG: hypothetical protein GXO78_11565 [Calditrichaeota bacterium]|nr:hypothetical protein [Calditrichota bacterium]
MKQHVVHLFSYFSFGWGFIALNLGFSGLFNGDGITLGDFCLLNAGLLAIFLSARADLLFQMAQSAFQHRNATRKQVSAIGGLLLLLILPLQAHSAPLDAEVQNVEMGTTYIKDSSDEQYRSNFALLKFRMADRDNIRLWIRQIQKSDPWGSSGLYAVQMEMAPFRWMGLSVGYQQMPVGTIRLAKELGPLHLAIGGGREAITSRSNAIADRIDLVSAYVDASIRLLDNVSLSTSIGQGRFGDQNTLRTFTSMVSHSRNLGPIKLTLHAGYSQRMLDDYSPYYWSPVAYREFFLAPDLGLELNGFWIYLNLSVDRILEERYAGDATGLTSWGANGEISLGYRIGPGYIYLTGRAWNSGIERATSGYRGQIFQVSYELDLD